MDGTSVGIVYRLRGDGTYPRNQGETAGNPTPRGEGTKLHLKKRRYCKHHIMYSLKVQYVQHKMVINLDHAITLAMTNRSTPPHTVLTLHHEYFDLKSKEGGHIIHGVFVRMESQIRGPLIDITHIVSNKEAKSILSKIVHCPYAWWYWHWVEKGYTQGTMSSLLNSFEAEVA
jgi:hypothetical protein